MAIEKREAAAEKGQAAGQSGIIDKILTMVSGSDDLEKDKRRLLKDVADNIRKSRYKFFNVKDDSVLPAFGELLYEIYKVVGPARGLLMQAGVSDALNTLVIEAHLSREQLEMKNSFSRDNIVSRLNKGEDIQQVAALMRSNLGGFLSLFSPEMRKRVDALSQSLFAFTSFAMYNYASILKRFDPNFPEMDFTYTPRFEPINAGYLTEAMKKFLDNLLLVTQNFDWDQLFDVFKHFRGDDFVPRPAWRKMIALLIDVKVSGILELILKHVEKDPFFKPSDMARAGQILDSYTEQIKNGTESVLKRILQEKRRQKTEQLVKLIFGSHPLSRLENYNDKIFGIFAQKMAGAYMYSDVMSYLNTFLAECVKKELQEFFDLMVVRGKWTTNQIAQQVSENFHKVAHLIEDVDEFDEYCSEENTQGQRIKKVLPRVDRDTVAQRSLRDALGDINQRALDIIVVAVQVLVHTGKDIKSLLDDYALPPNQHALIINWKEVENFSEIPIRQHMSDLYKKVYYFIQLLQLYAKAESVG
jgi:hypothetical protein